MLICIAECPVYGLASVTSDARHPVLSGVNHAGSSTGDLPSSKPIGSVSVAAEATDITETTAAIAPIIEIRCFDIIMQPFGITITR